MRAIEKYLTVRGSVRPSCKAVGEEDENGQIVKMAAVLTTQTETLTIQFEMLSVQSGAMGHTMARLQALERVSIQLPPTKRAYSEAVKQTLPVTAMSMAKRPFNCFLRGGPHVKRE